MDNHVTQTMEWPFMNNGRTLTMGTDLMVTDNLDIALASGQDNTAGIDDKRFPMKLNATCMALVLKGNVKFSVNFRDFVATENCSVMVTEGTIIENVTHEEGSRFILLSFSRNGLSGPTAYNQHNMHRLYALQVVLLRMNQQHMEMAKTAYTMLRTILSDPSFESNRQATAYSCLDLMGNIIMQVSDSQPELVAKTSRRDEIVSSFLKCVAENYRSHRELSFYAGQLGLSLKYMSHVVFEQTGRHPARWIKDYVILDAKTMLRSGRYSIQQIAEELNFPNQSFFGKYFKEAVGISPKKWK